MADIFDDVWTNAVPIADTATDADSPNAALTATKQRIGWELCLALICGLYRTGTLTSDPPNDTTGYAIDTAGGWSDDDHNGRRLVFTDGNALGQDFLIDDTDDSNNRLVCTGDNLYAAGARSGDGYIVIGNFRDSTNEGHTHDDLNSKTAQSRSGLISIPYQCVVGIDSSDSESRTSTVSDTSYHDVCEHTWSGGTYSGDPEVDLEPVVIYVPQNATTLRMHIAFSDYNDGSTNYRFRLTPLNGSGGTGTTVYSSVATEAASDWEEDDIDYDCSSLAEGYYELALQVMKTDALGEAEFYYCWTGWVNS